jgi:hypothetical protein
MSTVDIRITGLAICRPIAPTAGFPDGQSQILIIHPPNHSVAVRVETVGGPPPPPIPAAAEYKMSVTTAGSTRGQTVSPTLADDLNALVNIVTKHRTYGSGNTITLKPKAATKMKVSYLTIPSSLIYTDMYTKGDHETWSHKFKAYIPGGPNPAYRNPADGTRAKLRNNMLLRFNVPNDARSSLTLNILSPTPQSIPLKHLAGGGHTIYFDNDCGGKTCGNDFGYYYEIVEDKDAGNFFYEMEQNLVRPPVPPTGGLDSEASCNPVIAFPLTHDLGTWHGGGKRRHGKKVEPKKAKPKKAGGKKTKK